MAKTFFTPGTLFSSKARESFAGASDPALVAVAPAIDELRNKLEGLVSLHENPDPDRTRPGNAERYRREYEKASASALKLYEELAGRLVASRELAEKRAREETGIDELLPHAEAAEIRASLRAMKADERDAAIKSAFEAGDSATLRAVLQAPSAVTHGPISLPVESMIDGYLEQHSPQLTKVRADTGEAMQRLSNAYDSFTSHADQMRDKASESRAAEQRAVIKAAEAKLAGDAA